MLGKRKKDETDFYNLLIQAAENTLKAAQLFRNSLMSGETPAACMNEMKQLEEIGDTYTHTIYKGLTLKHPCPIDQEMLLRLAARLDDVLDGIEATLARFDYMNIGIADDCMVRFSEVLVVACDQAPTVPLAPPRSARLRASRPSHLYFTQMVDGDHCAERKSGSLAV